MMNAPFGTIALGAGFRRLLIVDVSTQALLVPQVRGGTAINKWWSLMQSAAGCPDRDHCRNCCWLSIGRPLEAFGSVWHEDPAGRSWQNGGMCQDTTHRGIHVDLPRELCCHCLLRFGTIACRQCAIAITIV